MGVRKKKTNPTQTKSFELNLVMMDQLKSSAKVFLVKSSRKDQGKHGSTERNSHLFRVALYTEKIIIGKLDSNNRGSSCTCFKESI